jgi:hypothetical protein
MTMWTVVHVDSTLVVSNENAGRYIPAADSLQAIIIGVT